MKEVTFELKRLRKTGIIFLTLFLAVLLSFANILFTKSRSSIQRLETPYLAGYSEISFFLYPPTKESAVEGRKVLGRTHGKKALESLYERTTEGILYPTNSRFFSYVLLASEKDQIELLEEEKQDLHYALFLTHYLERHHYEEETFRTGGALYSLRSRGVILYGIVPLLFFFVLSVWILGEELERGSFVFQSTLPLKLSRTLRGKIAALLLLAALYLLCVFLATTVISYLLGHGFGRLDYPLRIIGRPDVYVTTGAYLLRLFVLFLLKVSFVISLGLFFAVLFRRVSTGTLLGSFLLLLAYFFTNFVELLSSGLNPLMMEYDRLLLGFRTVKLDPANYRILGAKLIPPSLGWEGVLLTLSLFFLLFVLVQGLLRRDGLQLLKKEEVHRESLFGLPGTFLSFEWKKLQSLLSFKSAVSLMLILALSLSTLLFLRDKDLLNRWLRREQVPLLKEKIKELEEELDSLERIGEQESLRRSLEEELKRNKNLLEEQEVLKDILDHKKSRVFYEREQSRIKSHFGYGDIKGPLYGYVHGDYASNFGYAVSMKRNQLLIENNIHPMIGINVLPTLYDEMKVPADELDFFINSQPANHSAIQLIHRSLYYYRFDWILLALMVAFCGSGFTTDQQHGLAWIYTLPRKRRQILSDKLKASLLRSVELSAVFFLALGIYGLLTEGIGQWNYPFLEYLWKVPNPYKGLEFEKYYRFIPLGIALLKILLLMMLSTAFLQCFSLFLSTFKLKPIPQLALTLGLAVGGYALSLIEKFQGITAFLPFSFLDPVGIVSGTRLAKTASGMMSFLPALVILVFWSLFFYILTHLRIMKKKDVL